MSSAQEFPEIDPSLREVLAVPALLLNVAETAISAMKENVAHIRRMKALGRATTHRYTLTDKPDLTKPLSALVVPMRTQRVILKPEPALAHNIDTIVLRVPRIRGGLPTNAFLEVIHEPKEEQPAERERYVLSETGLFRYNSAADLRSNDDDRFEAINQRFPEHADAVEKMSRLISEAAFDLQTSRDISI